MTHMKIFFVLFCLKKAVRCIFLLIPLLLFSNCSLKEADPPPVLIKGSIDHPPADVIKLVYNEDPLSGNTRDVLLIPDENNAFQVSVEIPYPMSATLSIAGFRTPVFFQPGYEVSMYFDGGDVRGSLRFEGDGAAENNFLTAYIRDIVSELDMRMIHAGMGHLDPMGFTELMDSVAELQLDYLRDHHLKNELSGLFVTFFETEVAYFKYNMLLMYPLAHQQIKQLSALPVLPDDYYDFLEREDLFEDRKLISASYLGFLDQYLNYYRHVKPDKTEGLSGIQSEYRLAAGLFEGETRSYYLAKQVYLALLNEAFSEASILYRDYMDQKTSQKYHGMLKEAYEEAEHFSPGKPAPDFSLMDMYGAEISLSDYRGRLVLLHFWAAYSNACQQDLPALSRLQRKYQDEHDLVFISVSLDGDEPSWLDAVALFQLRGVHLNVDGFGHEVPLRYHIKSLPVYFLIGRDGRILDNRLPGLRDPAFEQRIITALQQ